MSDQPPRYPADPAAPAQRAQRGRSHTLEYGQVAAVAAAGQPHAQAEDPGVIETRGEPVADERPPVRAVSRDRSPDPTLTASAARGVREHRRRHPSANQAGYLVTRLCEAEPGAGDLAPTMSELAMLGNAGLEELAARFPGPLWRDPRVLNEGLPRTGQMGPIPAALLAFGPRAQPVVAALLRSHDPEDRLCAAAIASDFPCDEVLSGLFALLMHSDAGARRMALRKVSALSRLPGYAAEVRQLRDSATIEETPIVWRVRAIEALAELGDRSVVAPLIGMLDDHDPDLVDAAHQALCVLTAQDWGRSGWLWRRWQFRHGSRPRHEWLLAGLVARRARLREYALAGLSRLLGRRLVAGPSGSRKDCQALALKLAPDLGVPAVAES